MNCPACKNPLVAIEYHQVEVDYCTACRGVWLDAGELELLSEMTGGPAAPPPSTVSPAGTEKPRRCPICFGPMGQRATEDEEPVVWDQCGAGHGAWFDRGELAHALRTGGADRTPVLGWLGEIFSADLGGESYKEGDTPC